MSTTLRVSIVGALVAAALVPLGWTGPAAASGPVAYVAEGGSDGANTCTSSASPCATVSHALGHVVAGATVHVSGTIHDNVDIPAGLGTITISGADAPVGAPAVLDGSAAGVVVSSWSALVLDGLTIRNGLNTGEGASTGNGGGVHAQRALTVTNSTVVDNHARVGGGIYVWDSGEARILDSRVSGNTSTGSFGGGGVYVGYGSVNVVRSTVSDNRAPGGHGGGVNVHYTRGVAATVVDSTFADNSSAVGGGVHAPDATVVDSTFVGNAALWGSAVASWTDGEVGVVGSTLSDNTGPDGNSTDQGDVYAGDGTVSIGASILGARTSCDPSGAAPVSWGYNVLADTTCGSAVGDVVADPQLGSLQDNGGPTPTMQPGPASPALDRVPVGTTMNGALACGREDQRGVAGPAPARTGCSSGSVEPGTWIETDQAPLTVTSTTGVVGTPLALTTSGGSGAGDVRFEAVDGTATGCAVSGWPAALTATGRGTCVVTATKAAAGVYRERSSDPTPVTLDGAEQNTLYVDSLSGYEGSPLDLQHGGGSGTGAVSYAAVNGTASGCAVSGPPYRLTAASAGTCVVTATKAGDGYYREAASDPTAVTFDWDLRVDQDPLVVTSTSGIFGTPLPLTITGGSGGGLLTYVATDGSATGCGVTGAPATLISTTAGTCVVTATRAAWDNYRARSSDPTTVQLVDPTAPTTPTTPTTPATPTPPTPPTPPTTPVTAPSAVRGVAVSGKPAAAKRVLAWRAPSKNGGAAVTSYRVVVTKGAKTLLKASVVKRRLVLRAAKLKKGRLTVTVRAVNPAGAGAAARTTFRVG